MPTRGGGRKAKRRTRRGPRSRRGLRTRRRQRGGASAAAGTVPLLSPSPLVGYPWLPGQPGTWPGAASAGTWNTVSRLDTHGASMSNHLALSPNGVPAGGVDYPVPSNAINKQCGGRKKRRNTRRRAWRGGAFSPMDLITAPFGMLKDAGSRFMATVNGDIAQPSSSPLVQPIGEKVQVIMPNNPKVAAMLSASAAEVAAITPASGAAAHAAPAGHASAAPAGAARGGWRVRKGLNRRVMPKK